MEGDEIFDRIARLGLARNQAWELKQHRLTWIDPESGENWGEVLRDRLWIGNGLPTTLDKMSKRTQAFLSLGSSSDQAGYPSFSHIAQLRVFIEDDPTEQITDHFDECITFIDTHLEQGNQVFVHCRAGVSRSATICIAYLMKRLHLSFLQAYVCVKEARFHIGPNYGFCTQLLDWEKTLFTQ